MVMKRYNSAYSTSELRRMLRKGDFDYSMSPDQADAFRLTIADMAFGSLNEFCMNNNSIIKFHLRKKDAYKVEDLHLDLIVRKLAKNIKSSFKGLKLSNRAAIVSNLSNFLVEGVKYRVYRLDIKKFYESFNIDDVKYRLSNELYLNCNDRDFLVALLDEYRVLGGKGLPRGMAISSCISDFMMNQFDDFVQQHKNVCFYGRYVDDIVIVTTAEESKVQFKSQIVGQLPKGLLLNHTKQRVRTVARRCKHGQLHSRNRELIAEIEYLGYKISIFDPLKKEDKACKDCRYLRVDISDSKMKKIKSRIIRSLRSYAVTNNGALLHDRVSFLTTNYGVIDRNSGRRQLAGIFYNYPLLTDNTCSLEELDRFLKKSICLPNGRFNSRGNLSIPSNLRRKLLSCSFIAGHRDKRFRYFNGNRYKDIRNCWRFE